MLIASRQLGPARRMIRFPKFLETVNTRIDYAKKRYGEIEIFTGRNIQFLTKLLSEIHSPSVLKRDMLDVYLKDIAPSVPNISRVFDSAYGGLGSTKGLFIEGNFTEEFLIPTTGIIGTQATVLDGWDVWKNIKPIKMVANNSSELKTMWFTQIKYDLDKPDYAVFTIDTAALLIKYIVYLREHNIGLENPRIHDFINNELIFGFYDDLVEVWCGQLMVDIANNEAPTKLISTDVMTESEFKKGVAELSEFHADFVRGHFRMGSVLNTPLINGKTMTDMIYLQEHVYAVESTRRHVGYSLLKLSPIVNFVTTCLAQSRDLGVETSTIVRLTKDSRILARMNWQSHTKNALITSIVSEMLMGIETLNIETVNA